MLMMMSSLVQRGWVLMADFSVGLFNELELVVISNWYSKPGLDTERNYRHEDIDRHIEIDGHNRKDEKHQ